MAATSGHENATGDAMATASTSADDSDVERLSKKQRASSFVPDSVTPQPTATPTPPAMTTVASATTIAAPASLAGRSAATEQGPNDPAAIEKSVAAAQANVAAPPSAASTKYQNGENGHDARIGGSSAVAIPGLNTTVPAGEVSGMVQAVVNGGAENEAAVMMGEQPSA